jgi:hypothetical protein
MKGNADLMLLAARDCIELVKYPVTRYGKSEGWTHFRTDEGIIFNCRTLEGIYPFEELLIVFKEPDKELIIPKEMQSILQTAVIFATGEVDVDKNVELTIKGDKIICKSQKEKGWLIKEIDIKNIHKISFQFQVNPIFFAQILNKTTKFYMITKHRWPDKAAFATENFRHIITIPTQEEWEGEYAENSNKKKKRIL